MRTSLLRCERRGCRGEAGVPLRGLVAMERQADDGVSRLIMEVDGTRKGNLTPRRGSWRGRCMRRASWPAIHASRPHCTFRAWVAFWVGLVCKLESGAATVNARCQTRARTRTRERGALAMRDRPIVRNANRLGSLNEMRASRATMIVREEGESAPKTAPHDGPGGRQRCFMRLRNEAQAKIAAIAR